MFINIKNSITSVIPEESKGIKSSKFADKMQKLKMSRISSQTWLNDSAEKPKEKKSKLFKILVSNFLFKPS